MRAQILLFAIITLAMASCDDNGDGGFTPESPFRDLNSPENVLHNLAACYNERDYDHLVPMIRDDFGFFIWSGDIGGMPGELAPEGYFSKAEFLDAADKMLDETFVPCDTLAKIADMEMVTSLWGDLSPTSLEVAPSGTQEAYVNLDLEVVTVGKTALVVRSRPLFYFVPDTSRAETEGVTWQIWRVDDAENLNNPGSLLSDAGTEPRRSGRASGAPSRGNPAGRTEAFPIGPTPIEQRTWGALLAYFSTPCD